jgi:DNA-binding CsgD family transcriptional regulator
LGKTDYDIFPKEEADEITSMKRQVLRTGRGMRAEVKNTLNDEISYHDLTIEPLNDADGNVVGITCASWDVTARRQAEEQLRIERMDLERKNVALREVLNQIEEEKKRTADQLQRNVERLVMPSLNKLESKVGITAKDYLEHLRKNLQEITSPFVSKLEKQFSKLTPREVEICSMIRGGMTSKEIANALDVSQETIRGQRKRIRKKLEISGSDVNLGSYLRTLSF